MENEIIKKEFDFPDYYGANWDAFWDCLTDMVGRKIVESKNQNHNFLPESVLEFKDINYKKLKNINLNVHKGEILAIVGIEGNGQEEIEELIVGISKPESGSIMPAASLRRVDLPSPFLPVMQERSPSSTEKVTSSRMEGPPKPIFIFRKVIKAIKSKFVVQLN